MAIFPITGYLRFLLLLRAQHSPLVLLICCLNNPSLLLPHWLLLPPSCTVPIGTKMSYLYSLNPFQPWKWSSCHSFVGLISAWVLCRRPTIGPSVFSLRSPECSPLPFRGSLLGSDFSDFLSSCCGLGTLLSSTMGQLGTLLRVSTFSRLPVLPPFQRLNSCFMYSV